MGEAENRGLGCYPFLAAEIMFPKIILFPFLFPLFNHPVSPSSVLKVAPGLLEIWVSQVSCNSAFAEDSCRQTALTFGRGAQGGSFQHKVKSSHMGIQKNSERWELMLSFPEERCSQTDPWVGRATASRCGKKRIKKEKRDFNIDVQNRLLFK